MSLSQGGNAETACHTMPNVVGDRWAQKCNKFSPNVRRVREDPPVTNDIALSEKERRKHCRRAEIWHSFCMN